MDDYKIIVEQEHSTVMAHYDIPKKDAEGYQSEAKLEAAFIKQLQAQGYEYVKVKDEAGLLVNLYIMGTYPLIHGSVFFALPQNK